MHFGSAARVCLGGVGGILLFGVVSPQKDPFLDQAATQWELLNGYCVKCHNSTLRTGGVAFDALRPQDVPQNAELFEKVVRKLRGRMMPPPGQERPGEAKYDSFIAWLEGYLDHAAATNPNPGRVVVHRLDRKEYANAIEDLFALTIDPVEILPEDDQRDGFHNIATALHTSPAFFNQYVSAARSVAVRITGFEVRGPFNPTGLSTTPSRKRIFTCYPKPQAAKADEETCAREILSTIARRAYRRPVNDADMSLILGFYRAGRQDGRTLDYAKGNTGGRGQAPSANPETAALLEKLDAKRR